jgi:hypothetical protein
VNERDLPKLGPLQRLAHELRIALQLLHHTNAAGDRASGTNIVSGTADTLWRLERSSGSKAGRFVISGRDVSDQELRATFNGSGSWERGDSVSLTAPSSSKKERIATAVDDLIPETGIDRPTLLREVVRLLDLPEAEARNNSSTAREIDAHIERLRKQKKIAKRNTGPIRLQKIR